MRNPNAPHGKNRKPARKRTTPWTARLRLEAMEERVVPAQTVALGPDTLNMTNLGANHAAQVGSTLYYLASNNNGPQAIWQTDGTPAHTSAVSASGLAGLNPLELVSANGVLYFVAGPNVASGNVYRLNSGAVTAVTSFGANQGVIDLEVFGGKPYFTKSSSTAQALYTVTGTTATQLATFAPAQGIATLNGAAAFNGKLFFTVNNFAPVLGGVRVWVSDGTVAGTKALAGAGAPVGQQAVPAVAGSRLFLFTSDGAGHTTLSVSDGVAVTTVRAFNSPVSTAVAPSAITGGLGFDFTAGADGKLYFTADDGTGMTLWSSDGSSAGTTKVVNPAVIGGGFRGDTIDYVTALGSSIYFTASDTAHGTELWKATSGGGAALITDLVPGPGSSFPAVVGANAAGIWFTADESFFGNELWLTDGTTAGTRRATDLSPGAGWSGVSGMFQVGSNVIAEGTDGGTAVAGAAPPAGLPPTRLWGVTNLSTPDGAATVTTVTANGGAAPGQPLTLAAVVTAPGGGTPTGTVIFRDKWSVFGSANLVNGQAALTVNNFIVGQHNVQAVYQGSAAYAVSASTLAPVSISVVPNTLVLTSSAPAAAVGQAVTFTATPTPSTAQPKSPTGTVIFFDGGTIVGSALLASNGVATFTASGLSAGVHTIRAAYTGDILFGSSVSASLAQTVGAVAAVTLTGGGPATTYGQSITFTANVAGPSPRGSVNFLAGSTSLGNVAVDGSGNATLVTATLAAGTHTITAVYSDTTTITSNAVTQTVQKTTATTTLTTTPASVQVGQSLTLTATIVPPVTGLAAASGSVTFSDNGQTIGSATLVNGKATFSVATLALGSHSFAAAYGGNSNYTASTSAAVGQTVQKAASSTTLTTSNASVAIGQSVTLTATLAGQTAGLAAMTGTVTFSDGGQSLGSASVINGKATLTVSSLAPGSHSLTAGYVGDATYAASTSAAVTQTVQKATTTTAVTTAPASVQVGQSLTLTATVAGQAAGLPNATGTVTFSDNGQSLGSASVVNGKATFTTGALAAGSHAFAAAYVGDANYGASTSPAVSQTVFKAATTTSLTPSATSIQTGQSLTLTAGVATTAVGLAGLTGSVTFRDNGQSLGSASVVNGQATLTVSTLTVGSHSLTAVYAGDAIYAGSTSAAVSTTVTTPTQTSSSTTLTTSAGAVTAGQTVTFTATVNNFPVGVATTVTFLDGVVPLATVSLNGTGSASYTTSTLAAGSHGITARFNGGGTIAASTSAAQVVSVRVTSTTALTASPASPTAGQSVTLTATVTASGAVPTGTVTFLDGNIPMGTATLQNGVATFSATLTGTGAHAVKATYAGSDPLLGSTSAPQLVTIAATNLSTSTTVTASAASVNAGQSVTLTATVTASGAMPTGTVTFLDGNVPMGTATLQNGVATFSATLTGTGAHAVKATYAGSGQFLGSTSVPQLVTLTATNLSTSTTVTASAASVNAGQSVTLTATVTASGAMPTGTVTFLDGNVPMGTATLQNGVATFSATLTGTGAHAVKATYAGSGQFLGSTSVPQLVTIAATNLSTSTTVTASAASVNAGQSVTLTATVTASGAMPTGTVTFLDGNVPMGTATLQNGVATFSATLTGTGAHAVKATYAGSGQFLGSTSVPQLVTLTATNLSTSTTVTASAASVNAGQSVTLTATVTAPSGVPSGSVTFLDGNVPMGTATLQNGVATFSATLTGTGAHAVKATYAGSGQFLGSTSVPQLVTLTATNLSTSTTVTASAASVNAGQSVTLTATVTASGAVPTGTVTFLDGTTTLGTATLTNGTATFSTSALSTGTHSVKAVYAASGQFLGSTSAAASVTVNAVSTGSTGTVTTLTTATATLGQPTTLKATVSATAPGSTKATGTVTFMDGNTVLGTATLQSGVATLAVTFKTGAGTHSITATYAGDATFKTSASPASSLTVQKSSSTVTLRSFPASSVSSAGQTVTLRTYVDAPGNWTRATGTVTFMDGNTVLGTVSIVDASTLVSLNVNLKSGAHTITAVYNGSDLLQPATMSLSLTV